MAEYNLWLERELEYNCIIEQLKSPFVIQVFGEYDGSAGWVEGNPAGTANPVRLSEPAETVAELLHFEEHRPRL